MGIWPPASIAFFTYVGLLALSLPGVDRRRRTLALAGTATGIILTVTSQLAPNGIANDWLVPPALLLIAYWTSGVLYRAPMLRIERLLRRIDDRLRIRSLAAATPRAIAELLEFAYVAVYLVIPAALVIHVVTSATPDPPRFWAVVLVTDFICFGTLPWVQTRPPRALEPEPPWSSRFRSVNLHLLGKTSIQVNTFPSGHAAEALAALLLVLDGPASLVSIMLFTALAISAATVLGRYHFSADVFAGWAVALVVWLALWG
jgi:membrane-associated phospholipid phosphatase